MGLDCRNEFRSSVCMAFRECAFFILLVPQSYILFGLSSLSIKQQFHLRNTRKENK
jgi:hypothetical protein